MKTIEYKLFDDYNFVDSEGYKFCSILAYFGEIAVFGYLRIKQEWLENPIEFNLDQWLKDRADYLRISIPFLSDYHNGMVFYKTTKTELAKMKKRDEYIKKIREKAMNYLNERRNYGCKR